MWGEIKTAINSTTGAGMVTLDKIIVEESAEILYNLMVEKYGSKYIYGSSDTVAVIPREYETTGSVSGPLIADVYFSPQTKIIKEETVPSANLITKLYIPCVEVVQNGAFKNSQVKTVVLGSSLKSLGFWAFGSNVKTVFFKGTRRQWESVEKDRSWNQQIKAKIVCYDDVFED